ncbi:MAG: zinc-ribbon domain-containing protein [Dehalococcoidales bacterium]|nr:zinc-ribbon domain-containing protein [Dehalococcoidales bacterium]
MALINCPECGREISDQVKACPHCGYPLESESENAQETQPQQVEITGVNLKKQGNWKSIFIVLAVVVIGLVAFISIQQINKVKAQQEYETAFNAYIDNLWGLCTATIGGGAEAEELTNLTAKVWANSIFEDADPETDKYTKSSTGRFYDDFNTALTNLFSDYSFKSKIRDVEEYQEVAKGFIEKLQNPPAGLEACYATATDMYAAFLSYSNLAINPSGSLQSFNQDRRSKTDNFMDLYNKLEAQIPERFPIDD